MNFNHIVATDGYWAMAVLIALEAFGIPIPGEAVLVAAGTYAGQTHELSVWLIWIVAFAAVVVGSTASYWVGDKGGYRLLRNYGHYIRMREPEIKVGLYIFARYGSIVVSVGRFVAMLRTYAPFLAGTNRMPWHKFFFFNAAGALAWSGLWSFLSYELGDSLKSASTKVDVVIGVVVVALLIGAVLVVRRQAKRLEATAEAAFPGPLPD